MLTRSLLADQSHYGRLLNQPGAALRTHYKFAAAVLLLVLPLQPAGWLLGLLPAARSIGFGGIAGPGASGSKLNAGGSAGEPESAARDPGTPAGPPASTGVTGQVPVPPLATSSGPLPAATPSASPEPAAPGTAAPPIAVTAPPTSPPAGAPAAPAPVPDSGGQPVPPQPLQELPANTTPVDAGPGILPAPAARTGNCVVSGEVSDSTSLNPIAGAIVEALGTGRTAQTDAKGKFTLSGLPAGSITIEATKLGYFAESTSLTTLEGQPADARLGLRAKPADDSVQETVLEEETIVGEYEESSREELQLDLQAAPNIAAGISKEDFSRAGISDAAGAVSKIAGANIVGGKYAVVRGLGDRYSNTLVNNALISSADPSKKAIQLDLFPSDLLESVSILKSFTPDLPAEFAGGTVAIRTLRFPKEPLAEFSFGTGWNSNLGDAEEMRTIPGREFDFLGKTGDSFPASAGTTEEGLTTGYSGIRPLSSATPAQKQAAAQAAVVFTDIHLSAGMRPGRRDVDPAGELSLLLGNTYQVGEEAEFGAVFGFTWNKADIIREDVFIGRNYNPGPDGITKTEDDLLERNGLEDQYKSALDWGLLAALGLREGDRHEIGYTYFLNHSSEDKVAITERQRRADGDNLDYLPPERTPGGAGAFLYRNIENLEPLQRELAVHQLHGKHSVGDPKNLAPLVEWAFSRSDSLEDRPHSRTLINSYLDYTDPRILLEKGDIYMPELGVLITAADVQGASQGAVTQQSFRETLKTEEIASNGRADLTIPLFKNDDENFWNIKVGANLSSRDREVRGRLFTIDIPSPLNARMVQGLGEYGVDYLESYDAGVSPDGTPKFNGWTGGGARNRSDRLYITEATKSGRTVRNVDAFSAIEASYLMSQLKYDQWEITGGFRFESESRGYEVLAGLNPGAFVTPRIEEENSNFLPGVILQKTFGEEEQYTAALAWSKTIARPTFYEFAPVETEDQATGEIIIGNPNLEDTLIDNLDFRLDWIPSEKTALSLSLFHKSMQSPIAQAFDITKKTWVNGTDGTIQGMEFEASRRFQKYWSLTGNYTFIDSTLEYVQQVGTSGAQLIESTFEGQPEHILNAILAYDNTESGWGGSLVYNYTGPYLTGVPLTSDSPSIVREGFSSLDLILYKDFVTKWCDGNVKLKIRNLLGESDKEIFDGTDLVYRSFNAGRSVSLTFTLEF